MAVTAAVWTACTKLLALQKKTEPRRELNLFGVFAFLLVFLRVFWKKRGAAGGFFVVKLW